MKRMMLVLLAAAVLLCLASFACAEEAQVITDGITFEANSRSKDFDLMSDDDFKTYYPMKGKNGWLEIHSEKPVYGVYLMQFEKITVPLSYTLEAFGGKSGFDVAEEAFQFHRSQVQRNWQFERGGQHDNTLFGLYATKVGQDTGIGDFMEHIELPGEGEE